MAQPPPPATEALVPNILPWDSGEEEREGERRREEERGGERRREEESAHTE